MPNLSSKPVYVFMDTRNFARLMETGLYTADLAIEMSVTVSAYALHELSSEKGQYVLIAERSIAFTLPKADDVNAMTVDALTDSLQEMRAEHQLKQQQLIDQIARFRQLAAPKEGEVVDDRDLVQQAPVQGRADDAEDADFHHIPF